MSVIVAAWKWMVDTSKIVWGFLKTFSVWCLKKFIMFFGNIQIYKEPMFILLWGNHKYKVKGDDVREILNTLQPGDVLLRNYDHYLSAIAIKGHSHVAYFLGENKVSHMLSKGFSIEDILTFLRCDKVTVLRHPDKDVVEKSQIAAKKDEVKYYNRTDKTKPLYSYDWVFSGDNEWLYCCELVNGYYGNLIPPKSNISDPIYPDEFLEDQYGFKMIGTWPKK